MKLCYLAVVAVMSLFVTNAAMAGDAAAGEQLFNSRACIGCHGPAGVSVNPDVYPALTGKGAAYIVAQLKAFKDGTRSNPLMSPMATGLSDDDMANIAAYLGSVK